MTEALLQRVAGGDAAALEECMARYRPLVWSIARRFAPDYHDAEDSVQEIFIDLWRHAVRFRADRATETAFVATIARRRAIDRYRRRRHWTETSKPLAAAHGVAAAAAPDPVAQPEERTRVQEALGELRTAERHVLELAAYEGLSQAEIAAATHFPLGTVKTHTRRGLQRLRQLLGESGKP